MVETSCGARMRFDDLPCRARELISDIRYHHSNKDSENGGNIQNTSLRQKYAELIELIADCGSSKKPEGVTHFKITKSGDVVFINNSSRFGQAFKRLWSLHLPIC